MNHSAIRRAVISTVVVGAASVLASSGAANAVLSGCPSGAMFCVTSLNTSGYTTPSPQGYSYENDSTFANDAYSDSTTVEDRVNSIRARGSSTFYAGVCFYRDASYGVARTYVSNAHAGWYDNSSTDLSSAKAVSGSCV